MKLFKKILFITLGIIIGWIFLVIVIDNPGYKYSHDEELVNKITAETAKKLKEEDQLYLIGTGGQMMDDIQMMAMSFDFYQKADLKISRELLVNVINEYLLEINNNEEIRQYLHNYPFTAKNLEIRIWIYNSDRSELPFDEIYYISAIDGVLDYYIKGPDKNSRKIIWEETYEDAVEALRAK